MGLFVYSKEKADWGKIQYDMELDIFGVAEIMATEDIHSKEVTERVYNKIIDNHQVNSEYFKLLLETYPDIISYKENLFFKLLTTGNENILKELLSFDLFNEEAQIFKSHCKNPADSDDINICSKILGNMPDSTFDSVTNLLGIEDIYIDILLNIVVKCFDDILFRKMDSSNLLRIDLYFQDWKNSYSLFMTIVDRKKYDLLYLFNNKDFFSNLSIREILEILDFDPSIIQKFDLRSMNTTDLSTIITKVPSCIRWIDQYACIPDNLFYQCIEFNSNPYIYNSTCFIDPKNQKVALDIMGIEAYKCMTNITNFGVKIKCAKLGIKFYDENFILRFFRHRYERMIKKRRKTLR